MNEIKFDSAFNFKYSPRRGTKASEYDDQIPEDIQGKSIVPLFKEPKAEFRDAIYYHYYEKGGHGVPMHEGVRDSRYKLINFYDNDGLNLFDLEKDPTEMVDQSKNPEYKEILKKMKTKLEKLRTKYELKPLKK